MAGDGIVSGEIVIGVFVVSMLGLSVTPTIASLVTQGATNLSFTGAGQPNITYTSAINILELFPLFWVVLMIAIPIVAVGLYFKGI
jgi:hypothetical protein